MAEKKKLDVRALRDLARKHLGEGYSKATRDELLVALKDVLGKLAGAASKASRVKGGEAEPKKKAAARVKPNGKAAREEKPAPAKKAAAEKAAPAKKAAAEKAVPAKKAAPEKAVPAEKAAAEKAVPAKKAAPEKAVPAEKAAAKKAPAARRAAAAPRIVPRVEVTAFPPRSRPEAEVVEVSAEPAAPPRAPERVEPPPREPVAPAISRPPPPQVAEVPRPVPPPRREAPEMEELPPDVLVEGFFLTPEPRFRQAHAGPVGEGFFVARIAGEQAARRHGLTDRSGHLPPGAFEEDLGELPVSYGEDDVLALPRDPHSLFFFWDFGAGAAPGRAMLRVYDGDRLVREVELVAETRRFYLHDLPAGRTYRLEAHLIAPDGSERRVGEARLVTLPGEGPVRSAEVRFLKLPWHLALSRLREYLRDGRAQVEVVRGREAFTAWIRTPLPHSAELYEGIVSERAGLGEQLEETLGGWRPSPSGQRDVLK